MVMNKREFIEWVENHKWTFAKSMPGIPHYYVCKHKLSSADDRQKFEDAVKFIRRAGFKEKFRGREYTYFKHGSYKYWTMGNPIDQTIILNRAQDYQSRL